MRINARVHIGPDELQAIVEGCACGERAGTGGLEATITALRSLRPGRPVPTHRFAATSRQAHSVCRARSCRF